MLKFKNICKFLKLQLKNECVNCLLFEKGANLRRISNWKLNGICFTKTMRGQTNIKLEAKVYNGY
jgi:hypothetical protein